MRELQYSLDKESRIKLNKILEIIDGFRILQLESKKNGAQETNPTIRKQEKQVCTF